VKKALRKNLFLQVVLAIVLGILFGHFFPEQAVKMAPLGKAFINLIKMLIAPIIFCTIVAGVAGMGNMKQVGRVGAKALFCFEVLTTLAMLIGLLLMQFYHPGNMLLSQSHEAPVDISAIQAKVENPKGASFVDFAMNIIPTTLVGAFSSGDILQVLLIAILFAAAIPSLGERGKQMVNFLDLFSHILFKMVDFVTKLAPIGAFGAMSSTIGKHGLSSLANLGELLIIFYLTCAFFVLTVLYPLMRFYCKLSLWKFIKFIKEEIFIVLGTASSESALPRIMEKLEILGCNKSVVGMVIPTGYSFNLIGSSIYFTMGALFIAHVTNTPLSFGQQFAIFGILLLTSKGAAGVAGSSFIILAATMTSMKLIPQHDLDLALGMLFAIDRFLSEGRAVTNLVGNALTTVIVAKWENGLDHKKAVQMLDEGSPEL